MCGIFGFVGAVAPYRKKWVGFQNEKRGTDSVGFLSVDANEKCSRVRIPTSIGDAMRHARIPERVWNANCTLGHTRAASFKKDVSKMTAHPFKVGHIIGAHNGFVGNWDDIVKDSDDDVTDSFMVDSQTIFYQISKFGTKGLAEIRGSAAVWWVDLRNLSNVYLWVWNQSLSYAIEDGSVAFSSDGDHLLTAGYKVPHKVDDTGQVLAIDRVKNTLSCVEVVAGAKPKPTTVGGYGNFRGCNGDYIPGCGETFVPGKVVCGRGNNRPEFLFDKFNKTAQTFSLRRIPHTGILTGSSGTYYTKTIEEVAALGDAVGGLSKKLKKKIARVADSMTTVAQAGVTECDPLRTAKIFLATYVNIVSKAYWCESCADVILEEDYDDAKQPLSVYLKGTTLCCPHCGQYCSRMHMVEIRALGIDEDCLLNYIYLIPTNGNNIAESLRKRVLDRKLRGAKERQSLLQGSKTEEALERNRELRVAVKKEALRLNVDSANKDAEATGVKLRIAGSPAESQWRARMLVDDGFAYNAVQAESNCTSKTKLLLDSEDNWMIRAGTMTIVCNSYFVGIRKFLAQAKASYEYDNAKKAELVVVNGEVT